MSEEKESFVPTFGLRKHFIHRPVSGEWLMYQVKKINNGVVENTTELLNKVLDMAQASLEGTLTGRFIKDSEVSCLRMGNEFYCDYLFVFEEDVRSEKTRYRDSGEVAPPEKPLALSLREEFENLLFQGNGEWTPADLLRTKDGLKYQNQQVQQRYQGFKMHHDSFYSRKGYIKERIKGNLGLYFIGKIIHKGQLRFSSHPFRFQTTHQAYEAANKLAEEHLDHYAICRVIDVIGSPEIRIK